MSWAGRVTAIDRSQTEPDRQVDVESSEMREELGLRYYLEPEDERKDAEGLGRRIDDCLVDYISMRLQSLKDKKGRIRKGRIRIAEFRSRMRMIEEGMKEDPDLQAFAVTLQRRGELRPASETYLELARRHVLSEGKRLPSFKEGRRFAFVQLNEIMKEDAWETDWKREEFIEGLAVRRLNSHDPGAIQELIHASDKSSVAWDTLQLICRKLADRGERPPDALLIWSFMANHGHPERPDEGSAPRHRPTKLGYTARNNEIRYTVDLLALVGMPKPDGRSAVAEAFYVGPRTIQEICRKPYSTLDEYVKDARKRIEPAYHALLYEPDSSSGHS